MLEIHTRPHFEAGDGVDPSAVRFAGRRAFTEVQPSLMYALYSRRFLHL